MLWKNGNKISTDDINNFIKKSIIKINSLTNSDIKITNCWNWFTKFTIKPDLVYDNSEATSFLPSRQAKQTFYSSELFVRKNVKINVLEEFEQDLLELKNRG